MVKKWLSRLGTVLAVGIMVCSVYAEQATASFFLRPEQGAQGDTVWYELVYDSGTHSAAGAAFYFDLEPGVSVQQVLPGADVEKAEISYNSTGQELVLLYVDEDGGLSVPEQGAQLFRVALKNSFSENLFPFRVQKTDVCAALDNLDVIPVEATLQMKNLQGEQQNITPAQLPQEESVREQVASPQSNASGASSAAQASSAAPSETNSNAGHSQTAGEESAAQGALAEQTSQVPSSAAQESISQGQSEAASVLAQTSGNQALLLGIAVPLLCIAVGIAVAAIQKYRRKR